MITENGYIEAAKLLNVDVASIKAVAEVESGGAGFLEGSGEPKILFEPHIFYKFLKEKGLDPEKLRRNNEDLIYAKWGTLPYGLISKQHGKLDRAVAIDRDSALKSASWGKFQIMGFNFKEAGFANIQDFVNAMYEDEDAHLKAFVNFVKSKGLDRYLRSHQWDRFALGFNGKSYKKNKYDTKLRDAYNKYK